MDDDRRPIGDVLARHALHVSFEHIRIGEIALSRGGEINRHPPVRAEPLRFLRQRDVQQTQIPVGPAVSDGVLRVRVSLPNRLGRALNRSRLKNHRTGRSPSAPPNRYLACTAPRSVDPRTGGSPASVASTRKSGRRYAATRKLPVDSRARLLRRRRPGAAHLDSIGAECGAGGNPPRPLGTAPAVDVHGAPIDLASTAVANEDIDAPPSGSIWMPDAVSSRRTALRCTSSVSR